ncbi:hypothetical protein [Moraxella lacunata]
MQGVHSTSLHPNIIAFVVILKFIGYMPIFLVIFTLKLFQNIATVWHFIL